VQLARERLPEDVDPERLTFLVGDMTGLTLGDFHHVVAMDSLIHYEVEDGIRMIERLAASVSDSMLFTFAPRTPLLAVMHGLGRIFPRGNRAPAIEPVAPDALARRLQQAPELADWAPGRGERVSSGFYTSQACELVRRR
jgi:magnesium-protoporphyrin O-methyltransferase